MPAHFHRKLAVSVVGGHHHASTLPYVGNWKLAVSVVGGRHHASTLP